jgi:pimeloyl-ACP methyl ester carboxylesterase
MSLTRTLLLVFASLLAAGGRRSTAGEGAPPPEIPVESCRVVTADGAVLSGRRLRGGSVPVVLLHGLAASFHQFDLDAEGAPALAQFLARRGHDVWLVNLRGAGRGDEESTLAPGRRRWCADEYVVEDLPAIVGHVRDATRQRPFLLGHSLGGMSLAAYLAGAVKVAPANIDAGVRIDAEVARTRNGEIRGAIFLSAPARIAWPEERRPAALTRLAAIGREPARILLPARVPISSLNGPSDGEADPDFLERAGEKVQDLLEALFGETDWAVLAFGEQKAEKGRRLLKKMRGGVLADTSEDLLLQLAAGARDGTWPSYRGPEDARVDYSAHYGNITAPVFAGVGEDDRIASAEVIRASFLDKLGSADRRLTVFPGYGHSDITLADEAHRDVFAPIAEWIAARSQPPVAEKGGDF